MAHPHQGTAVQPPLCHAGLNTAADIEQPLYTARFADRQHLPAGSAGRTARCRFMAHPHQGTAVQPPLRHAGLNTAADVKQPLYTARFADRQHLPAGTGRDSPRCFRETALSSPERTAAPGAVLFRAPRREHSAERDIMRQLCPCSLRAVLFLRPPQQYPAETDAAESERPRLTVSGLSGRLLCSAQIPSTAGVILYLVLF